MAERKAWVSPHAHLPVKALFEDVSPGSVTENRPCVTGKPAAILVTAEAGAAHLAGPKKRGRKPSPERLSPAEKQAAYRERKKAGKS